MPCGIRVVTLVTLHAWLVSLAVHPAGAAPAALQMRSADDSTDGRRRSLDQRAREVKAPYPDAVSLLALLLLRRPASSLPSSLNQHTHYPCCCSSLCRQIVRTRTECAQNQTKPFFGLLVGFDRRSGLTENVKSGDLKMFVLEIPLITSREPKLSVLKTLPIDYRRLLIRLFPGCICIRDRGN